ncbi:hypothetical protein GCM10011289_15120 [Paludibacterium paludis]|uniref:Uncharacterized protein n=1 Tax=Paludibacterium paludis TaxID=1225769 RepID=A0A918U8T8_9NEIS|nr:hypothetical protein GCM10011289_15120 [Paludibacterium paludis]
MGAGAGAGEADRAGAALAGARLTISMLITDGAVTRLPALGEDIHHTPAACRLMTPVRAAA